MEGNVNKFNYSPNSMLKFEKSHFVFYTRFMLSKYWSLWTIFEHLSYLVVEIEFEKTRRDIIIYYFQRENYMWKFYSDVYI